MRKQSLWGNGGEHLGRERIPIANRSDVEDDDAHQVQRCGAKRTSRDSSGDQTSRGAGISIESGTGHHQISGEASLQPPESNLGHCGYSTGWWNVISRKWRGQRCKDLFKWGASSRGIAEDRASQSVFTADCRTNHHNPIAGYERSAANCDGGSQS